MAIQQLKDKATAAELCLIEAVIENHDSKEVDRFIKLFHQNIMGMTDAMMERRSAEGIKNALEATIKEFRK